MRASISHGMKENGQHKIESGEKLQSGSYTPACAKRNKAVK